MYLLIIAWVYVVVMMAISEAASSQGTLLGAFLTLVLYGLLPLSIVLYLMGTPGRRARRAAAAREGDASAEAPDGRGQAASDPVAPEGKEP